MLSNLLYDYSCDLYQEFSNLYPEFTNNELGNRIRYAIIFDISYCLPQYIGSNETLQTMIDNVMIRAYIKTRDINLLKTVDKKTLSFSIFAC